MTNKASDPRSAYPLVRVVTWGRIPGPGLTTDGKAEFVQSLQKGFFLHNDGTEAALSVQLEKVELACGPEWSIFITSEPVDIKSGDEAFMPVRWEKPQSQLDRYNLIGALARHYEYMQRDKTTPPRTMTIPISYTYRDWHRFSYRVKSNMIFSIAHPNGILRFETIDIKCISADSASEQASRLDNESIPNSQKCDTSLPTLEQVNDRRKWVDEYIDEVFKKTGKRIIRTDIWKTARYKTRTEFERWQRQDPRATKAANERFTRILRIEKPHLK